MATSIESVVCTAATPAQAKILVAMLQAEGIPARTDGEHLTDEFAASRRLLNLLGTRVFVPTASLERAREIVQPIAIEPDELERQALAAAPEPPAPGPTGPGSGGRPGAAGHLWLWLLLALGAAAVMATLWLEARSQLEALARAADPAVRFERAGDHWREVRTADGRTLRRFFEAPGGGYGRIETLAADGSVLVTASELADGVYGRLVETRGDGLTATWSDDDRDGVFDRATVTDGDGRLVQTIEWQPRIGFVVTAR